MYQLSNDQIQVISAGSQCEVTTHVYSTDPDVFFELNLSTSGDCEYLKQSLDNNVFHDLAKKWIELGYEFNISLHELD